MSAHTPGPWRVVPDEANPDHRLILGMGGIDVASVRPWMTHFEANAALIAAAPELLEALKGVANTLDKIIPCGDELDDEIEAVLSRARKAIAGASHPAKEGE